MRRDAPIFLLWRAEWRGIFREPIRLAEVIGFVVLCLLIFTFVSDSLLHAIAPSLMVWVTLVFGSVIFLGRSFDREWGSDGSRVLEGLRQMPGVLAALFWVRLASNVLVLLCVMGVAMLLVNVTTSPDNPDWMRLSAGPITLGVLGLTALGTLFSGAIVMQERRELLLPLLVYPLAIPLILAVSQCLGGILATGALDIVWLKLTAGTALLYVVGALLLFRQIV